MQIKRWLIMGLALLLAFSLAACGTGGDEPSRSSEPEQPEESQPDPEYPVAVGAYVVDARPGKVISLAPAITEKLCDLGYEDRIVGISKHCDYPASITALPRYGTAQLPDLEAILASAPHLVLCAAKLPDDAMEALRDAGIAVVVLPSYNSSLIELEETYLKLSAIMEGRTTGNEMVNSL